MIPVQLTLSGFLSYRDEVTLDFRTFDLACISGANGAGKSSLLDAFTWVLFGQARKRDDSLINLHPTVTAARVVLTFEYEGNLYRVERVSPRGKTTLLEFHIQTPEGGWKPLTERTSRATQSRIEEVLRLDYDTFTNASFFLQGNADQFTQQRPGDRKQILGKILGLQIWENYRTTAVQTRKGVETSLAALDGRIQEINTELAEEPTRVVRLKELEDILQSSQKLRKSQETIIEQYHRQAANLQQQGQLVENLARQQTTSQSRLAETRALLANRQHEQAGYSAALANEPAIRAAHVAWQNLRARLAEMDRTASQFHEANTRRQAPLLEIETTRARLENERDALLLRQQSVQGTFAARPVLQAALEQARQELAAVEAQLARRTGLETTLQDQNNTLVELKSTNAVLHQQMKELKERVTTLEALESPACPVCGQPLPEGERLRLVQTLTAEGTQMAENFRANKREMEALSDAVSSIQHEIAHLGGLQEQARSLARVIDQHDSRLQTSLAEETAWQITENPRLEALQTSLAEKTYAPEAQQTLARLNAELARMGYDAAAHDVLRTQEQAAAAIENDLRTLEKAAAALDPLTREIETLAAQAAALQAESEKLAGEHAAALAHFESERANLPDLYAIEDELNRLVEQENQARMEVGAARQKVAVLETLKTRRSLLETERESLAAQIARLKSLERAFGKDGVPALLIEQALPQIEARANLILDRLSNGSMSVHFLTQRGYKDKTRDDLRETLDIQISDALGQRDYEMYSGGEAFRVNFAIRLALSEVLAQRAGARLQTLVIDEGFGSQDAIGRQRLIEAINLIRPDFAKILVITHIDELKEAFPTRIEVEKYESGSTLRLA